MPNMPYVEGSYAKPHDALLAIKRLTEQGYRTEDIRLISNSKVHDTFIHEIDVEVHVKEPYEDDVDDDASLWEKIKDAFSTVEDYGDDSKDPEDDPLYYYKVDIYAGKVVVCVDKSEDH